MMGFDAGFEASLDAGLAPAAGAGFIVGLTGGIGSGKSAVAELFAARGVAVVDTDAVARALTGAGGAAMPAIVAAFGESVRQSDGALDRAAMRRLAFADPEARRRLEGILHPLIRREALARCQRALADGAPYAMLAVPLLVTPGEGQGGARVSEAYRSNLRRVLTVDCDEAAQIARVMARSGLTADEVRRIMSAQASRAERRAAADDLIDNSGDRAALAPQVEALHRRYLDLAAGG